MNFFLTPLLAQSIQNPAINSISGTSPPEFISKLSSAVLSLFLVVGVIIFVAFLIMGGISWITSGGDKMKLEQARKRLIAAVVGLIILLSFVAIISLLESFFGLGLRRVYVGPYYIGFAPAPTRAPRPPGPNPTTPPGTTATPTSPWSNCMACGTGTCCLPNVCISDVCVPPGTTVSPTATPVPYCIPQGQECQSDPGPFNTPCCPGLSCTWRYSTATYVCVYNVCGDGNVGTNEACDDGNTASGDGCRGDCMALCDDWDKGDYPNIASGLTAIHPDLRTWTFSDVCSTNPDTPNLLYEYVCTENDSENVITHNCPSGCSGGRCL